MAIARRCVVCQAPLSSYNSSDRCFVHLPDLAQFQKPVADSASLAWLEYRDEATKKAIENILLIVSQAFNITVESFSAKTQEAKISWPRQIVMYLLRTDIGLSLLQVASIVCRKDHTTILHGCRKVAYLVSSNEEIGRTIEAIRQRCRN